MTGRAIRTAHLQADIVSLRAAGRRGGVAILTALLMVPIMAMAGMAIDFALWNQAYAALSLAANGAALNAVKIAVASLNAGNQNFAADGAATGRQWFAAQIGTQSLAGTLSTIAPSVSVTMTSKTTITVKISFTGSVQSIFGGMFSIISYPVYVEADAAMSTAPYLEVQLLLDNSASMLIGAGASDMQRMMQLSPCAPSEVAQNITTNPSPTNAAWPEYRCSVGSWSYTLTTCPVPVSSPWTIDVLTPLPDNVQTPLYGPSCKGQPNITQNSDGSWPYAAAPCAFACHSDGTRPAGSGNDLLGVARGTIGSANPVTLRLDILKQAVNALITTMATDNQVTNSLTIGVWDFNKTLNQDYPTSGEAGNDYAAAATAVGLPPTVAYGAETGIIPDLQVAGNSKPDTYWDAAGAQLAGQLTASGNGTTAATPRKVLFIVGDGLTDENVGGKRVIGLYNTDVCTTFKNMGYTVYVLFTPYYPLAERDYETKFDLPPLVEPTADSASTANLQSCASDARDFIQATDQAGLTAALQTFLRSALSGAAMFTR